MPQKAANRVSIDWTPTCYGVFEELNSHFCSAPILKHFDPTLNTILETDASDYIVYNILSQRYLNPVTGNSILNPIALLIRKCYPKNVTMESVIRSS